VRQSHDAPRTDTVTRTPPEPPEVIDLRADATTTRTRIVPARADPSPAGTDPLPGDGTQDEAEGLLRRLAALPEQDPTRSTLRQQVVETKLPLVRHLAQRFRGRGEPLDDLVQVGAIGLLHAIDRFDPERGSFTAFAVPTIVGEIRRHFRDRSWALRVPRRLQDLGRYVAQTREELTHLLERSPTVREVADRLGVEPELVLEAMETSGAQVTVPLPSASEENGFTALGVADHGLNLVEDRVTLQPLLARLPLRERTILALRFVQGMSQSQIAQEVGVSQMHVSRLITRSLATLRQGLLDTP
jgi:RNA polymerase sigma-B factor